MSRIGPFLAAAILWGPFPSRRPFRSCFGRPDGAASDFEAFLHLEPRASMDPSMYSKKAIAAFEAARRKSAPPSEPDARPSMFGAFQEFKLPPNASEPVGDGWGAGPVQWITTFERRVAFADANFLQAEGLRGSVTAGANWREVWHDRRELLQRGSDSWRSTASSQRRRAMA
jgi:hypothetical protein